MTRALLGVALLLPAFGAQAGSIDVISCGSCKAPKKMRQQEQIELAPGTQKIEVREVNGEKKVFRTEAWLGGSPVTFVSKATPDMLPRKAETKPDVNAAAEPAVSIDTDTTSAVSADLGAAAQVTGIDTPAEPFDPGTLELRLN
jgi:hypothetical protein